MENKKTPIKVIIEDNELAVRCAGGEWLVGDLDNRWLWVLSAIAFPEEHSIEISDQRKNRQPHQVDLTTGKKNSSHNPENREFFVNTPLGKLKVHAKYEQDSPTDYPGVYIDVLQEGEDEKLLCCVEYDSCDSRLQSCVYQPAIDEPVEIIVHDFDVED